MFLWLRLTFSQVVGQGELRRGKRCLAQAMPLISVAMGSVSRFEQPTDPLEKRLIPYDR